MSMISPANCTPTNTSWQTNPNMTPTTTWLRTAKANWSSEVKGWTTGSVLNTTKLMTNPSATRTMIGICAAPKTGNTETIVVQGTNTRRNVSSSGAWRPKTFSMSSAVHSVSSYESWDTGDDA